MHTECMKRWLVTALLAGALAVAAGIPVLSATAQSEASKPASTSAGSPQADNRTVPPGHARSDASRRGRGHGPPRWAHGHSSKPGTHSRTESKKLSPEQHATMMEELARQHAGGMKEWTKCVADRRDDCVRPLPPGLAKKR
jgi:hypothetical protein